MIVGVGVYSYYSTISLKKERMMRLDTAKSISAEELLVALNRAYTSYSEAALRDTKNLAEYAFHNAYEEFKRRRIAIHQERNVWLLGPGEEAQ